LIYGAYSGAKFVFAGTPSGVSLSPEGGAHQSTITVSIGLELPNLEFFEPCFGLETEWCLLEGLRHCLDRAHGLITYLRLSTKPIDQALLQPVLERLGKDELRRQVLAGGYRLIEPGEDPAGAPRVLIAASGPMVPEAVSAAQELHSEGVAAVVLNITGADRLYRAWQSSALRTVRAGQFAATVSHFAELIRPAERSAPIVTVLDGASHALAFLGSIFGQPLVPLGADHFGQSGSRADLYADEGIDAAHIANAALLALGLRELL
jgi:pyruvate dehydrogenase E1 component